MPTQIQLKPVETVEIEPESAVPHFDIPAPISSRNAHHLNSQITTPGLRTWRPGHRNVPSADRKYKSQAAQSACPRPSRFICPRIACDATGVWVGVCVTVCVAEGGVGAVARGGRGVKGTLTGGRVGLLDGRNQPSQAYGAWWRGKRVPQPGGQQSGHRKMARKPEDVKQRRQPRMAGTGSRADNTEWSAPTPVSKQQPRWYGMSVERAWSERGTGRASVSTKPS